MQILAIDFGLKKVGLAIGNTLTKTSMPISTIFYKSKQELFNLLEKHVIEWKPEFIIIGNPLNMDQTESEMSKLAEKFLFKGHNVTVIDIHKSKYEFRKKILKKTKFFKANITSLDSLKKVKVKSNSVLLHCAGQASAALSFRNPQDDLKKNILQLLIIPICFI